MPQYMPKGHHNHLEKFHQERLIPRLISCKPSNLKTNPLGQHVSQAFREKSTMGQWSPNKQCLGKLAKGWLSF